MDARRSLASRWRRAGLALYVAATAPARSWRLRRMAARGQAPVLVVTYHRIADDGANVWTCSNAAFEGQIRWLRSRYDLVPLKEAQRRIREGNRRTCVSITFDDGYASNLDRALPLLVRLRIPVTYFVTLENVLTGRPFDHDAAMGHAFPPNTAEQLRQLAGQGVEMGCHGRTHRDVARITDPQELIREVVTVKPELEALTGSAIRFHAFPFGEHRNLSGQAFVAARQAGYLGACSAYGGYNVPGQDPFHIQRHSATEHAIRLINWATHDARFAAIPRFQG